MKLRRLKIVTFTHANFATLTTAVNDYTKGLAVTAPNSGTFAYAANEVGNRDLIDQQFSFNGTLYSMVLYYAE